MTRFIDLIWRSSIYFKASDKSNVATCSMFKSQLADYFQTYSTAL